MHRTLSFIVLTILLSACIPMSRASRELRDTLAHHWEHETPENDVDLSVAASHEELRSIGTANVLVVLKTDDLRRHLPAVKKAVPEVKGIQFKTANQRVTVAGEFTVGFGTNSTVEGKIRMFLSPSILNREVVLRPTFQQIEIEKVHVREEEPQPAVMKLANAAIQKLVDHFGSSVRIAVPLNLYGVASLNPSQVSSGHDSIRLEGSAFDVNLAVGRSAVMVDRRGIYIVAEAVHLTPDNLARGIAEIEALIGRRAQRTENALQDAVLSECKLNAESPDRMLKRLHAACTGWNALNTAARPASLPPVVAFDEYRAAFVAKASSVASDMEESSAVYVGKTLLATAITEVARTGSLRVDYSFPPIAQEFSQDLETGAAPNLNCGNQRGCPSSFEFRGHAPRGCDSNCGWDVLCAGRKLDCERLKEQERIAYEAEKAAAWARWKVDKDACEAAKALERLGCEAEQTRLRALAHMPIGRISGRAEITGGHVDAELKSLTVSPGFDVASLNVSLASSAHVDADFRYTPHNAGHLVCAAQWGGTVSADVAVPRTDVTLRAVLKDTIREGNDLLATFETNAQTVRLRVSPAPWQALLARNPHVAIVCPVAVAGAAAGAAFVPSFRDNLIRSEFEASIPARRLSVRVPAVRTAIGSAEVLLAPRWEANAVGLHVR